MSSNEAIKERVKVETERFKIYVLVIIVLGGGNYGLITKLNESIIYQALIVGGVMFNIFIIIIAIYSYLKTNNLLKKL